MAHEVLKLLLEPLLHLPWLKQVTRWNFQRYNVSLQWFRRNLLKWPTFWDSYESAVHNSSELNYLQSLLDGAAYKAIYIAGLTLSSVNYNEVDQILRGSAMSDWSLTDTWMHNLASMCLLMINAVMSDKSLRGLWWLHDNLEAHIQSLHALKITSRAPCWFQSY